MPRGGTSNLIRLERRPPRVAGLHSCGVGGPEGPPRGGVGRLPAVPAVAGGGTGAALTGCGGC